MKKLLLFLAVGCIAVNGRAQENNTILSGPTKVSIKSNAQLSAAEMDKLHSTMRRQTENSTARTTSYAHNDWYDLYDQNYVSGTSSGYYWAVSPDSNILDVSQNIQWHGMGMSFDPTDSAYWCQNTNINGGILVTPVNYPILYNQTYTIDSFYAPLVYVHNYSAATNDSLIIEIVETPITAPATVTTSNDSGSYRLGYAFDTAYLHVCKDGMARFGTIHYNGPTNDCYYDSVFANPSTSIKQRIGFKLNVADTNANGFLDLYQLLTGVGGTGAALPILPITVNAALQNVVSFITFKNDPTIYGGTGTYPLNTASTSSNWLKTFAGCPTGDGTWFQQNSHNSAIGYPGSYQMGVTAYNPQRYDQYYYDYPTGFHDVLIPAFLFTGDGFEVPMQSWHIGYTGFVLNTTTLKTLNNINVYPNPASNQLNVVFNMTQNADVTVSLTNMIGQTVSTKSMTNVNNGTVNFTTSSLANGVYIYTISANGERTTGQVVIAH
jgi:hypothetical protein